MNQVLIDSTNSHHVFTVQCNEDLDFQSVFPEPLSEYSMGHTDQIGAYRHLMTVRHTVPGASLWSFESPKDVAKILWEDLGNVPVNEDEGLDEEWCCFERGTDYHTVWQWFEEEFDVSIAKDLMFQKSE